MSTKKAYLDEVQTQLKAWSAEIDGYVAKIGQAQSRAKNKFRELVQAFSTEQETAAQQLEVLQQAGDQDWEKRKAGLEQSLTTLRQTFGQLKNAAQVAENESIGWAEGQAKEDVVESIGWAEGQAEEDVVDSIGWAEGMAKEDIIKSKGWAEGYEKKVKP